jgi:diacylglycerol kinase (ATP)
MQSTMVAAFANTAFYGGGMRIAPRARIDDGMLDACIVSGISPVKLLGRFPMVYAGRHVTLPEVEYFQAPWMRLETEHPRNVYADGEFVCSTPVEISIQPAALKVVVPAG